MQYFVYEQINLPQKNERLNGFRSDVWYEFIITWQKSLQRCIWSLTVCEIRIDVCTSNSLFLITPFERQQQHQQHQQTFTCQYLDIIEMTQIFALNFTFIDEYICVWSYVGFVLLCFVLFCFVLTGTSALLLANIAISNKK